MSDATVERRRLLLVDDHPVVRQGLARVIDEEPDLEVCGEAEDAEEALDRIEELSPDLVVVDLSLKGTSGLELIKRIRARFEGLKVLVLSMHDESLYAERALHAGARGYVMKQEDPQRLIEAARRVMDGELHLSEEMASRVLRRIFDGHEPGASADPVSALSDRELEVFEWIGRGRGTRQVAEQLKLSVKTVETYRAHIKEKLGISTASELVRHAVKWVESSRGA